MELTIHALSHSYGDKKALTDFTHTFTPVSYTHLTLPTIA